MERWQRTLDGRTDTWELTRDGATLTEHERVGDAAITRTAVCDTDAMAESIAARMVARHERAGFTRIGDVAPAPAATAPRPQCSGLTDKALGAVVNGVAKAIAGDAHKIRMAIHKAVNDWPRCVEVAWFLVAHQLVAAETSPGLWNLLAEEPARVEPEALFALLQRLPQGAAFAKLYKYGPMPWFTAGFERALDELLFAAYQRDAARFDDHAAELPASARAALDFVRGRSGVAIAPARADALLRRIAEVQCEKGLATNWEMSRVADGAVVRPRLGTADDVRAVALHFGTADAWRDAMVEGVRRASSFNVYTQYDGLRAAPLPLLAEKLAKEFSFSTNENLARILALFDARDDAPDALMAAAASITGSERRPAEVRDMLAVLAAGRFGARGMAVPEALDALLDLSFFSGVYHASIDPYVRGMAALPRERAHQLARRRLDEMYAYATGLAPLLAHFDDALLGSFFDKDAPNASLDVLVVGRFGRAALPHLARVWEATPRSVRRSRHRQVLEALATTGDRGEEADASWDRYVTFDQEGDEPLKYWDSSYAALRVRALRALPVARRVAQVLRCVQERPYPERAKDVLDALDKAGRAAVQAALAERTGA